MKLLVNKVHIQGMEVLLADKVHKQEPQRVAICFTHATVALPAFTNDRQVLIITVFNTTRAKHRLNISTKRVLEYIQY